MPTVNDHLSHVVLESILAEREALRLVNDDTNRG